MNKEEINHFIEHNLINFSVNSTGWNDLIRYLLYEFAVAGWNMDHRVFGKEKFGELRCYTYSEDEILNTKLKRLKVNIQNFLSGRVRSVEKKAR